MVSSFITFYISAQGHQCQCITSPHSFGPLAAFIRLWIECMIVRPCTGAIQSLSFSLYILKPFFPECEPPVVVTRLLGKATFVRQRILKLVMLYFTAAACLSLLCFINCYRFPSDAAISIPIR